mmetsp:Transcript_22385/g.63526  ORF Transcript_22385/g.63526 Transcript_22385/m.63526 type:complete len:217 (-) Transcript_22385:105-755(-)
MQTCACPRHTDGKAWLVKIWHRALQAGPKVVRGLFPRDHHGQGAADHHHHDHVTQLQALPTQDSVDRVAALIVIIVRNVQTMLPDPAVRELVVVDSYAVPSTSLVHLIFVVVPQRFNQEVRPRVKRAQQDHRAACDVPLAQVASGLAKPLGPEKMPASLMEQVLIIGFVNIQAVPHPGDDIVHIHNCTGVVILVLKGGEFFLRPTKYHGRRMAYQK